MIESYWKDQGHHKKQHQDVIIRGADNQQREEANEQNHELRRHHIRQNRADKKAVLAFEKRVTVGAVMPDVKRVCDDPRLATGGAAQSQTAIQYPLDFFRILLHGPERYISAGGE